MINQINEKFIDLFNTMGCKGEVCLDIPESPVIKKKSLFFSNLCFFFQKDFEKYGVNIKVQFRDGEKLHEMVKSFF